MVGTGGECGGSLVVDRPSASREHSDLVPAHRLIRRHEDQVLDLCLRDQHAIERVVVQRR